MSLLTLASTKSAWRGYEYYKERNVFFFNEIRSTEIKGCSKGSDEKCYEVFIDIEHPRKSKCTCPHADGKRIICKHMIALYFTVFPKEAEKYYDEVIAYELEKEEQQENLDRKLVNYIGHLEKSQLQDIILEILYDGPEWQYERFVRTYIQSISSDTPPQFGNGTK